jgi:hypothetical protein
MFICSIKLFFIIFDVQKSLFKRKIKAIYDGFESNSVVGQIFSKCEKNSEFFSTVPTFISNSEYWQNLMRNPNLERKK